MSVNKLNTTANLPVGATGVVFQGWSTAGDYTYPSTLPVGNYIAYASPSASNNYVVAPNSLGAASPLSVSATDYPTGYAPLGITSAETALNFSSKLQTLQRPTSLAGGGGFAYDGTYIYQVSNISSTLGYSTDGITWSTRTVAFGSTQSATSASVFQKIAYNAGVTNKFIITGINTTSATGYISTSTDGVTWTARTGVALGSSETAGAVVINPAVTVKYCLANLSVSAGNEIHSSTDGITWVQRTVASLSSGYSGAAATSGGTTGAVYVYANQSSSFSQPVAASTDGITWTTRNTGVASAGAYGVAYGAGIYLVTGSNTGAYSTSTDGITWTSRAFPTSSISTSPYVHFLNSKFHVWNVNIYFSSTDGITWTTKQSTIDSGNGRSAVWNGTRYLVNNASTNYTGRNAYYALYSTTGAPALN
jgi:hypothetical protein